MRGGESAVVKGLAGRGQSSIERGRVVTGQPGKLVFDRQRGVPQDAKLQRIRLWLRDRRWRRRDFRTKAIALHQLVIELDLVLAADTLCVRHDRRGEGDEDCGS